MRWHEDAEDNDSQLAQLRFQYQGQGLGQMGDLGHQASPFEWRAEETTELERRPLPPNSPLPYPTAQSQEREAELAALYRGVQEEMFPALEALSGLRRDRTSPSPRV